MGLIGSFIDKKNYEKSMKLFKRIEENMRDSTSKKITMYISTLKGYDDLFKMITDNGWKYEIAGNNREGLFLVVKEDV